jgi:nicotinamidase/pyrazinamidase
VIELDGVRQVLWPDHCVQGTHGAALHADLERSRIDKVVHKGVDRRVDSYSAFFDNARRRSTGLESFLREQGAEDLVLLGLATEYCVKFSALDAADLGFQATVLAEGCRGIDLTPGDVDSAWAEMTAAGVRVVSGPTGPGQ